MSIENQLKELAKQVISKAEKQGAQTAVVEVHTNREFECEVRNQDVENLHEAESFGISLTVSKDKKRASVHSCDVDASAVDELVNKAMTLAKFTDEDPFYGLPEPEWMVKKVQDLDLYDAHIWDLEVSKRVEMMKELEKAALSHDARLASDGAGLSMQAGFSVMANSLGFCEGLWSSGSSWGISLFADDEVVEGDLNSGRKQSGGWYSQARYGSDLEPIEKVAKVAAERVTRKLGAKKPKTGDFPVYFEPSVARSIWGHLLSAISGSNLYRKESFLCDRLGDQLFPDWVHILDDPNLRRGLGSKPYDGEGVACQKRKLVDGGKLNGYLLSCYSARKLNLASTGNSGGSHNVLIQPGNLSEAEILKQMDCGVYVTELSGQGVNIATGDYSRGAGGFWVENGAIQHPIQEFTLNGELAQMFQDVMALSAEVDTRSRIQTPGLALSKMAVSGT